MTAWQEMANFIAHFRIVQNPPGKKDTKLRIFCMTICAHGGMACSIVGHVEGTLFMVGSSMTISLTITGMGLPKNWKNVSNSERNKLSSMNETCNYPNALAQIRIMLQFQRDNAMPSCWQLVFLHHFFFIVTLFKLQHSIHLMLLRLFMLFVQIFFCVDST